LAYKECSGNTEVSLPDLSFVLIGKITATLTVTATSKATGRFTAQDGTRYE
jgi:hypothetical protein